MAKAKRARRNSFRTMSGDGALEALEMIERVVPADQEAEEPEGREPSAEAEEATEDES